MDRRSARKTFPIYLIEKLNLKDWARTHDFALYPLIQGASGAKLFRMLLCPAPFSVSLIFPSLLSPLIEGLIWE